MKGFINSILIFLLYKIENVLTCSIWLVDDKIGKSGTSSTPSIFPSKPNNTTIIIPTKTTTATLITTTTKSIYPLVIKSLFASSIYANVTNYHCVHTIIDGKIYDDSHGYYKSNLHDFHPFIQIEFAKVSEIKSVRIFHTKSRIWQDMEVRIGNVDSRSFYGKNIDHNEICDEYEDEGYFIIYNCNVMKGRFLTIQRIKYTSNEDVMIIHEIDQFNKEVW